MSSRPERSVKSTGFILFRYARPGVPPDAAPRSLNR